LKGGSINLIKNEFISKEVIVKKGISFVNKELIAVISYHQNGTLEMFVKLIDIEFLIVDIN
jgi:hypothetical protein